MPDLVSRSLIVEHELFEAIQIVKEEDFSCSERASNGRQTFLVPSIRIVSFPSTAHARGLLTLLGEW